MFALALGTLPEDFLLQPERIAADVAHRTDQWVSKPFAAAQGLSAAEFRATYHDAGEKSGHAQFSATHDCCRNLDFLAPRAFAARTATAHFDRCSPPH
jgi:hypothetical protein